MVLTVDIQKCVGCRICELACSFHNERWFSPEDSRIRVFFNDHGDVAVEMPDECDCTGSGEPLCVEFCPTCAIIVTENHAV